MNLDADDNNLDETVQDEELEGRRIVDIKYLFSELSKIKHEHTDCTFADLKFLGELRTGFVSKYTFECKMCKTKEMVYSEDPKLKLSVNDAVVEGIVCSGNGYGQLNEICSVLNMPNMSNSTYTKIEQRLTPNIEECALDEMIAAGQEEKRLAVLNGDVDNDGCPLISVVADGSWAKRSYKSGFSSASGAACIVGLKTKKVLFLGVRNSYCCICARSAKLNIDVPEHRCFKNWNDSANAMEADIIAEGFAKSMEMHGVKYNKLIGDGDSSVMKKLLLNKPYGHDFTITKIECKNHLLRNFCNKIKALGKKTNNHKGFVPVLLRKKVESNVLRMRKAVVGAINYRKDQDNVNHGDKIRNLKIDIKNAANHVFGDHKNCASYYCKPEKYTNDTNLVPDLQACGIWTDIQQYLLMLLSNAESLILDITNNTVEQFNNVIAKFIGGKRVNYTARGSYQARCFGAVTSWNSETAIHARLSKKIQDCSPGKYTKQFIDKKRRSKINRERSRKKKIDFGEDVPNKRRKVTGPDENYGRLDLEPDIPPEIYEQKKSEFILQLNNTKFDELQQNTVGQSENKLWAVERRKRLTASNFGQICKLRKTTSVAGLLKSLLYSQFKGTLATNYGREKEDEAIQQFIEETGLQVSKCGLFVDKHKPFLAASPDGLVEEDSVVEVKCPYKIVDLTPKEGIEQKKIDFCVFKNDTLQLKRNHNYYFQVQGQLHITGRNFCYFILWSPKGLLYEKIKRDDVFWQKMEHILETFYFECLLPEIIDGRIPRHLAVRERKGLATE